MIPSILKKTLKKHFCSIQTQSKKPIQYRYNNIFKVLSITFFSASGIYAGFAIWDDSFYLKNSVLNILRSFIIASEFASNGVLMALLNNDLLNGLVKINQIKLLFLSTALISMSTLVRKYNYNEIYFFLQIIK